MHRPYGGERTLHEVPDYDGNTPDTGKAAHAGSIILHGLG